MLCIDRPLTCIGECTVTLALHAHVIPSLVGAKASSYPSALDYILH